MDFIGNLLLFPAVKEFCKSVNNWQSYHDEFGVDTKCVTVLRSSRILSIRHSLGETCPWLARTITSILY